MENYIKGNKEAWEEAFEKRDPSWGRDIVERITDKDYAFFYGDAVKVLEKYDFRGKSIGQFCCNNGRELLSLVKTTGAKEGIGFDIASNMVRFANEKASELKLPCKFVETNILDIGDEYAGHFDAVIITIGATCWFKDLNDYFKVVSRCMKAGGVIIIHEQHPFTNMLAQDCDEGYIEKYPFNCVFSYFEHVWISNSGMNYIVGKPYESKTFTDYTHPISEFIGSMCSNGIVVTGMREFQYDISGAIPELDNKGFPLSMIIEGRKEKL